MSVENAPRILEELGREVPLLIVLEDLQFADASTLKCLDVLARRHSSSAVCVVATCSHATSWETSEGIHRVTRDLKSLRRGSTLRIGDLTPDRVTAWIADRLGWQPDERISTSVFAATNGRPARVARAVDVLVEVLPHMVTVDGNVGVGLDLLLSTIDAECAEQEAEDLTPDDRIVLETAAILGAPFTARQIADALDLPSAGPVAARLGSLASGGTIVEQRGRLRPHKNNRRYAFRLDATADRLLAPIPIARCALVASSSRPRHTRPSIVRFPEM